MKPDLTSLPDSTLEALAKAIERGSLSCPLHPAGAAQAGFGEHASELVAILGDLDARAVLTVLGAVLSERERHTTTDLELVWTGPLTRGATHRDTGVVMRQLFTRAEHEVLLAGYSFDHGEELFAPLHEAMTQRGVKAQFFLDIKDHASSEAGASDHAHRQIKRFLDTNWCFEGPRPEIYFDPRTAWHTPSAPYVSLHAKCVVVDTRWSLVTSANFTDRAQTRNLELGVLIEDEAFSHKLATQWQTLIITNQLTRYTW